MAKKAGAESFDPASLHNQGIIARAAPGRRVSAMMCK